MNEELQQLFLERIQAETDPIEKARLMDDLRFTMTLGQPMQQMTNDVIRANKLTPSDLGSQDFQNQIAPSDRPLVQPAIPTALDSGVSVPGLPPATAAMPAGNGRTVGDLAADEQEITAGNFLDRYLANQAAATATPEQPNYFHAAPLIDVPRHTFGQSAQQVIADSVLQRNQILDQLRQEEQDYLAEAQAYRTGEREVQRSGLTDMLEVANTPEDFQRIKAAGKIPIPARDAQLILETARREANALLRAGEEGVQTAAINRRQILGEQAATAVGSGLTAALTGVNVGAERLSELRQQAEQARRELLQSTEQRRNARMGAESLNSRAQIDAMIARLEPMQAVSQLMQTDEMDRIQRQFQAERDAVQRAEASRLRRQELLANDLQFKSSAAALAATSFTPYPGQFIQPRSGSGSDRNRDFNMALYARINNAATQMETTLETLKSSNNIFTNNQDIMDQVIALTGEVNEIIQDAAQLSRYGQLSPEVGRSVQEIITMKNAALEAMQTGEASARPFRSAEDELEDQYRDQSAPLYRSLQNIKNINIFGDTGSAAPTATGGGQIDFNAYK